MSVPVEVINQGYVGEVDAFLNALTITILKPGTTLEDAKRSLEIVIQDLDLRMKNQKPAEAA